MIEQHARRTKIVKSFEGKALSAPEAEKVAREEVDVLRLVWSAKGKSAVLDFLKTIKKYRTPERPIPVMLDVAHWTQAVVTGLKEPRAVVFGEKVVVSQKAGQGVLQLTAERWPTLFKPEHDSSTGSSPVKVFFGTGLVVMDVLKHDGDKVELEVKQGGTIYPDSECHVPSTRRAADMADVSVEELQAVLAEGIDYVLVPGAWDAARIKEFKARLVAKVGEDAAPWILGKVDSGAVYERLRDLLAAVDGVMISRREMSQTVNPATVPMITKEIIQQCSDLAKIVVTASEMLASMRRNATPTRAEVSDVANAVLDGTDSVVLSEEAANGTYGTKAVEVMARIIRDIEDSTNVKPNWIMATPHVMNEMDAIAFQAYRTAERVKAKAIVCITKAGNTALKLASFRPPLPVIAVTFSESVRRRLTIVRGTETLLLDVAPNLDEVLPMVNDQLVRSSWLKAGDPIVFVAITLSPVGKESSNLLTVQILN